MMKTARTARSTLALPIASFVLLALGSGPRRGVSPPNLIYVFSDEHRWHCLQE